MISLRIIIIEPFHDAAARRMHHRTLLGPTVEKLESGLYDNNGSKNVQQYLVVGPTKGPTVDGGACN